MEGEIRQPGPRLPQTVADILESMTDAFVALDRDWHYLYVNRRAGEMFGRAPEDLVGKHIWTEFPEGVGQPFHLTYEKAMREQTFKTLEDYFPPFGRWFENRVYPSPEGLTIFFQDITDRKLADQELARREQRYRTLAHAFSSAVWSSDAQGRAYESETWTALTGRGDGNAAPDVDWIEAVHADDQPRVAQAWAVALAETTMLDVTYRVRTADGSWRHVRARGVPVIEDGEVVQWIGVIDDVTEQLEAEDALRRAAVEDPLTGLPNRAHFLDRVAAVLSHRKHGPMAVMYIDVDRFKAINDALGHAGGDDLLRAVADGLRAAVRPSDVVSRLSGDEFAVMCDDLETHAEGIEIARRLGEALAVPVGEAGTTSASIGVAFAGPGDRDAEALLRDADAAMYEAKGAGGATVEVFDQLLRTRLRRRKTVEDELRAGLDGDALDLHFQPVVSFSDGWASTAEALLRWKGRDGTTLPAAEVVSVAEQTEMIVPIGAEVLARACRSAARWNASGPEPIAISVNVSAQQLARPAELLAQVGSAIEDSGLAADLLWLEITESMLMEHRERSEALLATLRDLGVKVALDDFGVGYSSLSYLHRLPVDAVKVDRSFIAGLPHDRGSVRIVEAVVGLGRAFRTGIVAEGVETEEQLDAIRGAGCSGVQGFALARPVPEDELPAAMDQAVRRARA